MGAGPVTSLSTFFGPPRRRLYLFSGRFAGKPVNDPQTLADEGDDARAPMDADGRRIPELRPAGRKRLDGDRPTQATMTQAPPKTSSRRLANLTSQPRVPRPGSIVARRIWPLLAIGLALGALFEPLITHPDRFPTTARDVAATGAFLDVWTQMETARRGADLPLIEWATGRNLVADAPALATHPLFRLLEVAVPVPLAVSLLVLLHLAVGAAAVYHLVRRARLGALPAVFASLVFFLTGGILDSGVEASAELGLLFASAIMPLLVLTGLRLLERADGPRAVQLGLTAGALACAGDLAAVVTGGLLAAASLAVARLLAGGPRVRQRALFLGLLALLWGLALGGYRWLPLLAATGGSEALAPLVGGPWWRGMPELRLPYHLGAVTLVTFLLGTRNLAERPETRPLLGLAALGIALAALGPALALPFLGFFLGIVSSAAFAGWVRPRVPLAREALALGAVVLLALEAGPVQSGKLRGRSLAEIVPAPAWFAELARHHEGGRVAILGPESHAETIGLGLGGFPAVDLGRVWADAGDVPDHRSLTLRGVRYVVSDRPDPRERFPLVAALSDTGKYLYRNPGWLGPAAWTRALAWREPSLESPGRPELADAWLGGDTGGLIMEELRESLERDEGGPTRGPVAAFERDGNTLRCRVNLARPALLLVFCPRVPGLRASVDGRDRWTIAGPAGQVGVPMSAGDHTVELRFVPPGLEAGGILSVVAGSLIPVLLVLPILRRRARREARPHLARPEPPPPRARRHQRRPRRERPVRDRGREAVSIP